MVLALGVTEIYGIVSLVVVEKEHEDGRIIHTKEKYLTKSSRYVKIKDKIKP